MHGKPDKKAKTDDVLSAHRCKQPLLPLPPCPQCGEPRNDKRGDVKDTLCHRCRSTQGRLAEYSLIIQDRTHVSHNCEKASELRGLLEAAYGNPEDQLPLEKIATQLQSLRNDLEANVQLEDYTLTRMPIEDVLAFVRGKLGGGKDGEDGASGQDGKGGGDAPKKKRKPKPKTVGIIRAIQSGKSTDEVAEATGTTAPNVRTVRANLKADLYEI